MAPADSFVGYEGFWADEESRLPESAAGGIKSRRDPVPVCEDLPSRVVARCSGDPAAGMGSGSAQVQALDRRAISGPSGNRSQDEGLVERHLPVIDVSLRESESALQVSRGQDRKSTRLNSSHITISYAVFCLKKKIDSLLFFFSASGAPRSLHSFPTRRSSDLAGMGSGSAQVQALDRRAISGPSGNRSQDEGLVERHLPVIDVSLRESESALQVSRG